MLCAYIDNDVLDNSQCYLHMYIHHRTCLQVREVYCFVCYSELILQHSVGWLLVSSCYAISPGGFEKSMQYCIGLIFCGSKISGICVFDNFVEKISRICCRSRWCCKVSKFSVKYFCEWHRIRENCENLDPQNISTMQYITHILPDWCGNTWAFFSSKVSVTQTSVVTSPPASGLLLGSSLHPLALPPSHSQKETPYEGTLHVDLLK